MMRAIPSRRQAGVAAIEFAILLIPLVILTFGMTELGRAIYYYNQVVVSTRDAARYLSMQSPGEGEAVARCLAVYGQSTCTGDPLAPGLATDLVHISYETGVYTGHGSIDLVRVSVESFPFTSLAPALMSDLTYGPISTTMRQGGE